MSCSRWKSIVFGEEKRFIQIKIAKNMVPINSLIFCLKKARLEFRQIDCITIGWDSHKYTKYMDQFYQKSFPKALKRDRLIQSLHKIYYDKDLIIDNLKFALRSQGIFDPLPPIQFISHHRSHAASTFYPSPFEKALILTIDESGEENATVIWKGKGEQLNL